MFGSAAKVVEHRRRSEQARTSLGILAAAGNLIGPAAWLADHGYDALP